MLTDDARKPERKPNARFNPALREHLQQPTLERRLHDSLPQQEGYSREKDSLQSSHTMLSRVYRRGKVIYFSLNYFSILFVCCMCFTFCLLIFVTSTLFLLPTTKHLFQLITTILKYKYIVSSVKTHIKFLLRC